MASSVPSSTVRSSDIGTFKTVLPNVQQQNISAGAQAIVEAGDKTQAFGDQLAVLGAQEQREEEGRLAEDEKQRFQSFKDDKFYGKDGLFTKSGAAFGAARAGTLSEISSFRKRQAERLQGTTQKIFNNQTKDLMQGFETKVAIANVSEQRVAWQKTMNRAAKQAQTDMMNADPFSAEQQDAKKELEQMIAATFERAGGGTDDDGKDFNNFRREKLGQTHSLVVLDLLTKDQLVVAKKYFAENEDEMTGEQKIEVRKALKRDARERLAILNTEVNDTVDVLDDGGLVPAGTVKDQEKRLVVLGKAGVPALKKLREAAHDNPLVRADKTKPLAERKRSLAKLQQKFATEPSTGAEKRLLEKLRQSLKKTEDSITKGEGLLAAAEDGLISPLQKLDLTDPESYKQRAIQAAQVTELYGTSIQPMLPVEIKTLNEIIMGRSGPQRLKADNDPGSAAASVGRTVAILAAMKEGLGKEVAESMAAKAIETSGAASMVMAIAPTNLELAERIISGLRIMQASSDFTPTKTNRNKEGDSVLENTFAGEFGPTRDTILDAADALYALKASEAGNTEFDPTLYEQAINEVTGGILKSGNRSVMAPVPGMQQGPFDDMVEALTPESMLQFGSAAPVFADGTPFTPDLLNIPTFSSGVDAELVSTGFGKYMVFMPGSGFVLGDDGNRYEIDLRAYQEEGQAEADRTVFERGGKRKRVDVETRKLQVGEQPGIDDFGAAVEQFELDAAQRRAAQKKRAAKAVSRPFQADFERGGKRKRVDVETRKLQVDQSTIVPDIGASAERFGEEFEAAQRDPRKAKPLGTVSIKDASSIWGVAFQTSNDPKKIKTFQENVKRFAANADPAIIRTIQDTVARGFSGDEGTNPAKLQDIMVQIGLHESAGFTQKVQKGGPARGIHQVEPATVRSLIAQSNKLLNSKNARTRKRALLGLNARQILQEQGFDVTKKVSTRQIETFLADDIISTVFATAQLLTGAKANKILKALQ